MNEKRNYKNSDGTGEKRVYWNVGIAKTHTTYIFNRWMKIYN